MAKSKKRKVSKAKAAGAGLAGIGKAGGASFKRIFIALAAVAIIVGVGYTIYSGVRSGGQEKVFLALAAAGQSRLPSVSKDPNLGDQHLDPGQGYDYGKKFPTSGPHAPTPSAPGFYDDPQPAVELVHALEHGHIVIYIDNPSDEVVSLLEDWASLYLGRWDGVVVVPRAGLGEKVVLTAWRLRLDQEAFDAEVAAAFIDKFRGRGPENPVR